jgi:hypothetical protein
VGKEIDFLAVLVATFSGVGVNETEPLGIVEPFHLTD